MDMASQTRSAAERIVLGLCVLFALTPASVQASAVDTYYEHTLMSAADARCHLFAPQLSTALNVAKALSRGAALRSGIDEQVLADTGARAERRAAIEPCNSADLATVADREKSGFEVFSRLQAVSYKGDFRTWWVKRQSSASGRVWNLYQPAEFGSDALTFGIAGSSGVSELITVAQFADGATPYVVRLVIRDKTRAARPYLDQRTARPGGKIPLSGRVTPRGATEAFLAEAKFAPDPLIRPANKNAAIGYRFPPAAARAIASLDPREAIEIEFIFSSGGNYQVRKAYIEVGDFAAGRAFLVVAQR